MEHLTLTVGGMTCMGCVGSVKRLLGQVAGVSRVEIDLASGRTDVDYDADLCNPADLHQAIADGGYQVAA